MHCSLGAQSRSARHSGTQRPAMQVSGSAQSEGSRHSTSSLQPATANTAKANAEAALATADERAETRLREISAKNGGTLPPKDHTAGNSQTGGKPENKLTGREKTIAISQHASPRQTPSRLTLTALQTAHRTT